MKFNLKNRPMIIMGSGKWFYDSNEVNEWFEGFEKELKELEKIYAESDSHSAAGKYGLIKEILGK